MARFSTMVCPLCARSRPTYSKTWRDPEIRWDFWNEDSPIIQIREGGGKKKKEISETNTGKKRGWTPGYGFPTVETLTLEEALNNPEYEKYIKTMFSQIEKIYKIMQKFQKNK